MFFIEIQCFNLKKIMSDKSLSFVAFLVNGYVKMIYNGFIPKALHDIIGQFYGYLIPCKIYSSNFWSSIDKPFISLHPNGPGFVILRDIEYKISGYGINTDIDYNIIGDVISNGVCVNESWIYSNNNKILMLFKPAFSKKLSINISMIKSHIIEIKSSWNHVLFLTEFGNVYGFGMNSHYQLSNQFKKNEDLTELTQIHGLTNIKHICAGHHTSFGLNKNGMVYSFGGNTMGELGINKTSDECMLDGNINKIIGYIVETMDCVYDHIGIKTNNNDVFFWGSNESGQCGTNDTNDKLKPTKITMTNIDNIDIISEINCGSFHSIIKTNNNFYSFGDNSDDELILNTTQNEIKIPTKIDIEYVKRNTGNNGDIIDIIPGDSISYIMQKI